MQDIELPKLVPFPTGPIAACAVVTMVLLGWLTWSLYAEYRAFQDASTRLLQLSDARGAVTHLDEVLTMSANMAAATGETAWIDRYRQFEPQLTAAIESAIAVARSPAVEAAIAATDAANTALVEMENRSFAHVLEGRPDLARAILTGEEYAAQKRVYAAGMADVGASLTAELDAVAVAQRASILATARRSPCWSWC